MTKATLAESALAYSTKNKKDKTFLHDLSHSRKFVLDKSMSSFLADLCYKGFEDIANFNRKTDELIALSRNPYDRVWIEVDNTAFSKRQLELVGNGSVLEKDSRVDAVGFLITRIDDAYVSHIIARRSDAIYHPPFVILWAVGNSPLAKLHLRTEVWASTTALNEDLFACAGYKSDRIAVVYPARYSMLDMQNYVSTIGGIARRLFAFLATINDVPTIKTEVRAPRGVQRRKAYQQFLDYEIITLRVPAKESVRTIANNAIEISRRRAHEVRGHWRLYQRGEGVLCHRDKHEWVESDIPNEVKCTKCPAWKTWIPNHQRGDAMLGFVVHDYEVTH